jgi:CheY-like chemotaxis protein
MSGLCNILLVEDNEGDIELVESALERERGNYKLSVTHDGLQALDYLHRRGPFADALRPDLILLDINMPGMDGKEFLQNVRNDEDLQLIPVIMLTSSTSSKDIRDCYALNASAYVVKPSDAASFMDVVRRTVVLWSDAPRASIVRLLKRMHQQGGKRNGAS